MFSRSAIFVWAAVSTIAVSNAVQAQSALDVFNSHMGYSISLPAGTFRPIRSLDGGKGQKFLSTDGRATIVTYAEPRAGTDVSRAYTDAQKTFNGPGSHVTYRARGRNWFAISGTTNGKIFFHKTLASNGLYKMYTIQYPQTARATYDPLVNFLDTAFTQTGTTRSVASGGHTL